MHKKLEPAGKRRSEMRWEQGRLLVEQITPTLPSSSHVAVLLYCWFRARGRDCVFSESAEQIGEATKVSKRHVVRVLGELEAGQVLKTVQQSKGRGNLCRRMITGKPFVKGDTMSPQAEIKGDTGRTKR
jgi:hypothetical protein